ncbi:hypothetical protein [Hymenobacter antarcticus]|uniref:Uncharacterized protein n=1 Tax=Hymenobacter antarcticus TaxID=486270 RepID=A0ABP7R0B0_9BACT
MEGQKLMLADNKSAALPLEFLEKDVFLLDGGVISLKRGNRQKVNQFELNGDRVKHLTFDRLELPKTKAKPAARTVSVPKKGGQKSAGA